MSTLEALKDQFNQRLQLVDKRPGISQLMVPLFHEDGDMVDIFLEGLGGDRVRVCDYGMTLMRLSYKYEVDTPNKQRILTKILTENGLKEEDGNLYVEAAPDQLYPAVMQFAQAVAKVGSMRNFKREIIRLTVLRIAGGIHSHSIAGFPSPEGLPASAGTGRSGGGLQFPDQRDEPLSVRRERRLQGPPDHYLVPRVHPTQTALPQHRGSRRFRRSAQKGSLPPDQRLRQAVYQSGRLPFRRTSVSGAGTEALTPPTLIAATTDGNRNRHPEHEVAAISADLERFTSAG